MTDAENTAAANTDAENTAPLEEPALGVNEDELEAAGIDLSVAEAAAPDREIAVEVGENIVEGRNLTVKFGGLTALDNVTFDIRRGEILGLIGPNGAGKTTCFNAMTGVYKPTSGDIRFAGEPVTGHKKHEITRMGIARTFQNIRLFPEMTALENVMVGADSRHKTSVVSALFRLPRHVREERSGREG